MNARSVIVGTFGAVIGLVAMVLVIVLPSSDETCETGDVLVGSSAPTLPQLGADTRAGATSATATSNATVTGTPSLAAGVGPLRRTLPMEVGTFTISDVFGSRGGGHKGIDMAAADGTTIYSVSDGRVVAAGPASGFGNWIVVDSVDYNGRAYSSVYGHMWDHGVKVRTGDTVTAGQPIGMVGSAGESSGPHLHFEIVPGGRFTGGRQIDPMPWLDGAPTPDVGGARAFSNDPSCVRGFGSAGGLLADGKVPAELEIWYRRAGTVCPEISSSLLAAQAKQESGFRRGLTSPAGAQGLAQFLPGTAVSINPDDGQPYIIDADGNGTASVWDDGDAIIGQARYMCAIAHKIAGWIAEGKVSGDLAALTLAGYNAGEGAVLASGGMPNRYAAHYSETRPYVTNILAMEPQYRAAGAQGRFTPEPGGGGPQIAEAAHDWLGVPYVWGGGGPQGPSGGGFDGPGLTAAAVFAATAGEVDLPRTAEQQWEAGVEVPLGRIAVGDLVFSDFGPHGPAQVGIYAGDGQVIQAVAPSGRSGGGVAEVAVPGDARARRVV
ncbi:peptidoglycan DD-metalloendopeptidase family protein [Nocardia caishijiensis]|uniref:Transglycosylase-like protein with SLT domain n=1 Tax=Nocardia caishijiensis TaxID=184756 RepID=A0ABQ6YNX0_9NOCA|nr:peptidoglycan DD-metalloendopeptidase family protein [Nocardia caishijiensis]KAF0847499.1 transglycosylase-like protein with SLT domain [Nocardia caishijiensis]